LIAASREPTKLPAKPLGHHPLTTESARPSIETSIPDDLADRMRAIDPAWRLERENGELVLYGNDMPAAWTTDASCLDWLKHMERDKRKLLKRQQQRRDAKAAKRAATKS
jgi:hypothetical protein